MIVASVIPLLSIWYMTSPMVMWMHVPVPKNCRKNPERLEQFINQMPPNTELAITTMGLIGKARVSKLPLKDLCREKRRFGLVNYVRNVTRENAARRWYQFRPVSQFRIEDGLIYDKKSRTPWKWHEIQKTLKNSSAESVGRPSQNRPSSPLQRLNGEGAAGNTRCSEPNPSDSLKAGNSSTRTGHLKQPLWSERTKKKVG